MKPNSDKLNGVLVSVQSTIKELDRISIEQNRLRDLLYEMYKDMKLVESDLLSMKRSELK